MVLSCRVRPARLAVISPTRRRAGGDARHPANASKRGHGGERESRPFADTQTLTLPSLSHTRAHNSIFHSPTFQRFAVRSNAAAAELAKKSAEKQAQLAKSAAEFSETFTKEVRKGLEEVAKGGGSGPPPKV